MKIIPDYDLGDEVVITATFTPLTGLANPGAMTGFFKVVKPDGTAVPSYAFTDASYVTVLSVVQYRLAIPPVDMPGEWTVRCVGLTGIKKAEEMVFNVRDTLVPTPLTP